MDLREIAASSLTPYRCYIRGNSLETEGENVHTIGFKDGLAVLKAIPPSYTDMHKLPDNILDNKVIDLTKLKKIIVKIDPKTGKKYIHKDGRRIEILPQIRSPIISLREDGMKSVIVLNGGKISNMKYQVIKSGKKTCSVETMTDLKVGLDKFLQTDSLDKKHAQTQTDVCGNGRESPFMETLVNFILGNDESELGPPKKMIDINKLKTKEEIQKFSFFNDIRNAHNFDQSGNLPIHDSVIRNNSKAVQKNCTVLKAIKEDVNILNQNSYAPLHLAVVHDVNEDIIKILLQNGADISLADAEGNTAIHLAIEHGRSTTLKLLINGCEEHKNFNLDVFNYEGFTPLILAVLNHSYEDAKFLLEKGADPNIKDMKSGRTALFHAAEGRDVNLVKLLMQNRADTKIRNFFGTSPHDAMFELDDMLLEIKLWILGRDHQRFQNKKKLPVKPPQNLKKAKLETTPVLKKVSTSDFIGSSKRK